MSHSGTRILSRLACALCVLLFPIVPALAEPDGLLDVQSDSTDRWVPAIGVYSAVNFSKVEGLVDSSTRGSHTGEKLKTYAGMEGHLELMSPALFSDLGQPRLFVRGGVGRTWDTRHRVATDANAGKLVIPDDFPGGEPPLEAVTGQGSEVRAQFSPYHYTLAAGIAFTFPLEERTLRVRSSLEYRRGSMEIEGVISDVKSIANGPICPCATANLSTNEQEDHDLLGAGLEVELDTARTGPFVISLFISTQAYRVLSGRKLRTAGSSLFTDGITPVDVSSRVFLDEWMVSGGVGLRFRWLPE